MGSLFFLASSAANAVGASSSGAGRIIGLQNFRTGMQYQINKGSCFLPPNMLE